MYDIVSLFSTATYVTLAIEFAFGLGFGYFLGKLVKALIGLMILGAVAAAVNYTQFVTLSNSVVQELGITQTQLVEAAGVALLFLSLSVIAPLTVGLVLGFLIGR